MRPSPGAFLPHCRFNVIKLICRRRESRGLELPALSEQPKVRLTTLTPSRDNIERLEDGSQIIKIAPGEASLHSQIDRPLLMDAEAGHPRPIQHFSY